MKKEKLKGVYPTIRIICLYCSKLNKNLELQNDNTQHEFLALNKYLSSFSIKSDTKIYI